MNSTSTTPRRKSRRGVYVALAIAGIAVLAACQPAVAPVTTRPTATTRPSTPPSPGGQSLSHNGQEAVTVARAGASGASCNITVGQFFSWPGVGGSGATGTGTCTAAGKSWRIETVYQNGTAQSAAVAATAPAGTAHAGHQYECDFSSFTATTPTRCAWI